jgi:hypothetical protein
MESSGSHRSGLLTAGGILSIVGGSFEVIGGGIIVLIVYTTVLPPLPLGAWFEPIIIPTWLFIAAMPLIVLGIIAIVGGVSALRRKSFGLSLAGAICALPSMILGILAIIFVSLSNREFEAQK